MCVCVIDKQHVSLCYVIAASFFLFDYSSQLTHLSYYLSNSAQVFRLAVPGLSLFVVCSFISLVQKIPVIFACMWTRIIRLFLRHVRSRLRGTLVRRKKEKKKLPPPPPPPPLQTKQTKQERSFSSTNGLVTYIWLHKFLSTDHKTRQGILHKILTDLVVME